MTMFNYFKQQRRIRSNTLDTTRNSLGGALASHVNQCYPNQVRENLSFRHGSGFAELFQQRSRNTRNDSHTCGNVSVGVCLSKRLEGGFDQSVVSRIKVNNALNAQGMNIL